MELVTDLSTLLPSPEATAQLAARLGAGLGPGDVILLDGPVGAGKSHFARALIQARMQAAWGRIEDVPSPSFTLVQSYDLGAVEIWHADLYRLGDVQEVIELGLDEAFESAICLIEWAERLGSLRPAGALAIRLEPGTDEASRIAHLHVPAAWAKRICAVLSDEGPA